MDFFLDVQRRSVSVSLDDVHGVTESDDFVTALSGISGTRVVGAQALIRKGLGISRCTKWCSGERFEDANWGGNTL